MELRKKSQVMDRTAIEKAVKRMAHEILEKNKDIEDLVIIGIRNRGAHIAYRLAAAIKVATGPDIPVGALDITL